MPKYIVRYGIMRSIGVMASRNDIVYRRSMEVIVRTDRGIEVGQVLCEATEDALSHLDQPATGHVIREVSNDDVVSIDGIDGDRKKKLAICQKHIEALTILRHQRELEVRARLDLDTDNAAHAAGRVAPRGGRLEPGRRWAAGGGRRWG